MYTHRKIIKAPLLHPSLGPLVFLSFFLSLSPSLRLSLSLSYCWLQTTRFQSIKGPQQVVPRTRTLLNMAFWTEWLQAYWGQGLLRLVSSKTWVKWLESPHHFSILLHHLFKAQGLLVSCQWIEAYFQTVIKCNPWFPDKCSFDLEIWHWVKENVEWATKQEKNIPIDFWPLWPLIKAVILTFQGKF